MFLTPSYLLLIQQGETGPQAPCSKVSGAGTMMRVHASPSLNKRAEAIGVKLKADDPSPIPSTMLSLAGRDQQCRDEPTPRWQQPRRRSKVSTEQHGARHGRPDPEGEHVRHYQTEQQQGQAGGGRRRGLPATSSPRELRRGKTAVAGASKARA